MNRHHESPPAEKKMRVDNRHNNNDGVKGATADAGAGAGAASSSSAAAASSLMSPNGSNNKSSPKKQPFKFALLFQALLARTMNVSADIIPSDQLAYAKVCEMCTEVENHDMKRRKKRNNTKDPCTYCGGDECHGFNKCRVRLVVLLWKALKLVPTNVSMHAHRHRYALALLLSAMDLSEAQYHEAVGWFTNGMGFADADADKRIYGRVREVMEQQAGTNNNSNNNALSMDVDFSQAAAKWREYQRLQTALAACETKLRELDTQIHMKRTEKVMMTAELEQKEKAFEACRMQPRDIHNDGGDELMASLYSLATTIDRQKNRIGKMDAELKKLLTEKTVKTKEKQDIECAVVTMRADAI